MKKIFALLILLTTTAVSYAQSAQSLRDYLSKNSSTLNPIEGIYDVEVRADYITPFVHQKLGPKNFTLYIIKGDANNFNVFVGDDADESYFSITQVGQTNVYYFSYMTSKCRIYLADNNCHFVAKLSLDNKSAKYFIGNSSLAPSVHIYPVYDCIKTYPIK